MWPFYCSALYFILGPTPRAEIGASVLTFINNTPLVPIHDLQGNLIKLITLENSLIEQRSFTAFGEGPPSTKVPWGFASKRHDPETSLVYFGRCYYSPHIGRFITPDPERFTSSYNLYQYTHNNPLTRFDAHGLLDTAFFLDTFEDKPEEINWQAIGNALSSPYFVGPMQLIGGLGEAAFGVGLSYASMGTLSPLGTFIYAHGVDHMIAGTRTILTGRHTETLTSRLFQKAGFSANTSGMLDSAISIAGVAKATSVLRAAEVAAFSRVFETAEAFQAENGWVLPKNGGGAFINERWYTEHALERIAPRTPEVMAELEKRFIERSEAAARILSKRQFQRWWHKNKPNPRGIPPSVVESEIMRTGSTGIRVELNEVGDVITIIPRGNK